MFEDGVEGVLQYTNFAGLYKFSELGTARATHVSEGEGLDPLALPGLHNVKVLLQSTAV